MPSQQPPEDDQSNPYQEDSLLISEIPVARWVELLNFTGWPDDLPREGLTSTIIENWYRTGTAKRSVRDALGLARDMRSPDAYEKVTDTADELGIDREEWPSDVPSADLAIHLWMAQQSDEQIETLLQHVRMILHQPVIRAYREFHGPVLERISDAKPYVAPLLAACQQWCHANKRGGHVEVYGRTHGPLVLFEIIIPSTKRSHSEVDENGRTVRTFRIAGSTFMRYDNETGKFGISASGKMSQVYRTIFGKVLFADADHFDAQRPTCSLQVLRRGASVLRRRHGSKIYDARLVECTATSGEEETWTNKSPDCFASFARTHLDPSTLSFREAKLRLMIQGVKKAKTIKVVPPFAIHGCEGEEQEPIMQFLEEIGIVCSGILSGEKDWWDVSGHVLPESAWRNVFGRGVADLRERRILVNTRRQQVESPALPVAGPVLDVEEDPETGIIVGISTHPDVSSMVLNDTQTDGLRFDVQRLAHVVGRALGLGVVPTALCQDTAYDVGEAVLGTHHVRIIVVMRSPADVPALLQSVAAVSGTARPLYLMPARRQVTGVDPVMPFDLSNMRLDTLMAQIGERLGITGALPARQAAPEAVLTVEGPTDQRCIKWHGEVIPMERGTHHFKMINLLALHGNQYVKVMEIGSCLSPHTADPEAVSRKAKGKVERILKRWFVEKNRSGEVPTGGFIETKKKNGYRLRPPCYAEPEGTGA